VIKNSEHFVYMENQFFITATNDRQKPIKNKIGAAIVERIIRAARSEQKWKMIVIMPAIPAFAGDLRNDDALSTRAIMEFQYNSINRGGDSIYETIARAGYNPMEYIRFYNLRNYDRINSSAAMDRAEQISGVKYEDARKQFDEQVGGGFGNDGTLQSRGLDDTQSRDPYPGQPQYNAGQAYGQPPTQAQYQPYHPSGSVPFPSPPQPEYPAELPGTGYQPPPPPSVPPPQQQEGYGEHPQYQGQNPLGQYQEAAQQVGGPLGSGRWDTVSECYMLNGEDIRNVPWEGSPEAEIDAFVTEELYIHSKVSPSLRTDCQVKSCITRLGFYSTLHLVLIYRYV
jgi:phospholipase D1/2